MFVTILSCSAFLCVSLCGVFLRLLFGLLCVCFVVRAVFVSLSIALHLSYVFFVVVVCVLCSSLVLLSCLLCVCLRYCTYCWTCIAIMFAVVVCVVFVSCSIVLPFFVRAYVAACLFDVICLLYGVFASFVIVLSFFCACVCLHG